MAKSYSSLPTGMKSSPVLQAASDSPQKARILFPAESSQPPQVASPLPHQGYLYSYERIVFLKHVVMECLKDPVGSFLYVRDFDAFRALYQTCQ